MTDKHKADNIEIIDTQENIIIPKGLLVVLVGVSGSGKSSSKALHVRLSIANPRRLGSI